LYSIIRHPLDGGLDVVRAFFSRSDTTLAKVTLRCCNFGTSQDVAQLLAALLTTWTVPPSVLLAYRI
jgi:hypothetical protein